MADQFVNPVPQYLTDDIKAVPGGLLNFFITGTTTRLDTFSDVLGTIVNTNPVVLDAAGRIPAIFIDGTYRVTFTNKDGVQIWERDPVGSGVQGGSFADWNSTISYSTGDLVTASDGERYQSIQNSNLGNNPAAGASPTFWEQIILLRIWNVNVTYAINDTVRASDGLLYRGLTAANLGNDPANNGSPTNWGLPVTSSLPDYVISAAQRFNYDTLTGFN